MGNVDIISKIFVQSDCCATFSQTFPILTKTPEFYLPNFPNTITLRSRTMLATVQNLLKGWGDGGKHLAKNVVALHAFKLNKYLTCYQLLGDQVNALPLLKIFSSQLSLKTNKM